MAVVWVAAPATVPIYDGIGTDAPYRYLAPPPGWQSTPPPTIARTVLGVTNGTTQGGFTNSGELGPQVSLYLPPGSLRVARTDVSATVTATPLAPRSPFPDDGHIVTNVYRLSAAGVRGALAVHGTGSNAPALQMRAPDTRQPGPVFEHRVGQHWLRSRTLRVGQDIYQTTVAEFGDWALVRLNDYPGTRGSSQINVGLLAVGLAVLVLTGAVAAIRRRRAG